MHERTYEDGTVTREFFATAPPANSPKHRKGGGMDKLRQMLDERHAEAMRDGRIVGVRTVLIDESALCPCASGKPFVECCASKIVKV